MIYVAWPGRDRLCRGSLYLYGRADAQWLLPFPLEQCSADQPMFSQVSMSQSVDQAGENGSMNKINVRHPRAGQPRVRVRIRIRKRTAKDSHLFTSCPFSSRRQPDRHEWKSRDGATSYAKLLFKLASNSLVEHT